MVRIRRRSSFETIVLKKLDAILNAVKSMSAEETQAMKEIDDLVAQAKATDDAEDAALLVIKGIAAQIAAAVAASPGPGMSSAEKAQLVQLAADLKSHSDALAAAIVTPPVSPASPTAAA